MFLCYLFQNNVKLFYKIAIINKTKIFSLIHQYLDNDIYS